MLGRLTAVDRVLNDASLVRVELFGGLELPTGDSDELAEEEDADAEPASALHSAQGPARPHHGGEGEPTGIHDQDLALGSGSVDIILGANAFATYRRLFGAAGFQYGVRTRGAHGYRYANDLAFHLGVGGYLLTHSAMSLALETRLTGETKGNDDQHGETVTGSGLTALYVGPQLHATYAERARFAVGIERPVLQDVLRAATRSRLSDSREHRLAVLKRKLSIVVLLAVLAARARGGGAPHRARGRSAPQVVDSRDDHRSDERALALLAPVDDPA